MFRATSVRLALIGGTIAITSLTGGQAAAQTVACGAKITSDTKLAGNLIDCVGDGIVIDASNITLDLNGYVIDGDSSGGTPSMGAGVRNDGHDRVTIKNGSIREFTEGVDLENATRNRLRELWVSHNGAGIELADADNNRIERNVAVANDEGIGLGEAPGGNGSDRNLISRNRALDNMVEGIALENGSGRNRVTRSEALLNGIGILSDSTAGTEQNVIDRNVADTNLQDGIQVGATTVVRRNRTNKNAGWGINAAPGTIDAGGNRTSGNGIAAQCDNVVCH
jgi:parallel beta-helix repeat protein